MKLKRIEIYGFGKFRNMETELSDGINIIYGKNEAGKSTLHTFIRAMFFGLSERPDAVTRKSPYLSYEPWGNTGEYGGSLEFSYKGENYRIERDFSKSARDLHIYAESSGKEVPEPSEFIEEVLGGLSEAGYTDTISIGQLKSATDKGMAEELSETLKNLNMTGSSELSYDRAIEYLKRQKENFSYEMVPDAAIRYSTVIGRIRNIERELSEPKYENRLPVYTELKDKMSEELLDLEEEKEKILLKTEKAKKTLSENNIKDKDEAEKYEKKCTAFYEEYEKLKKSARNRAGRTVAFMGLLLGAFFIAAAAFVYFGRSGEQVSFMDIAISLNKGMFFISGGIFCIGAAFMGLFLAILSFAALTGFNRKKRIYENAEKHLKEIFEAHIGNGEISGEALSAFKERMEEFKKLCEAVSESEKEIARINGEIIKLHENKENCSEIIVKEEKLRTETEERLMELNALKSEADELKRIIAKNNVLKENAEATELAMEKLKSLSARIKNSMGMYVNREASKLIKSITAGVYDSMDVGENMEIYMNTEKKMVPIDRVSAGTVDQIYLALRLSAVKLMEKKTELLPLIFDDSFALYDDERLSSALSFIASDMAEGEGRQVLIFTCHNREERILKEARSKFRLSKLRER